MGVEEVLVADDRTSLVVILPPTRISHLSICPGDAFKIVAGHDDDHHLYFRAKRQLPNGIEASAAGYHPKNEKFTTNYYHPITGMRTITNIPGGRIEKI